MPMRKMETTRSIIPGSILRVYKKGFGYSKLSVIEANDYYLAALADPEFYEIAAVGDLIDIYLWVEHVASYEFSCEVTGKISGEHRILFFSHTTDIKRSEKRKCLKASVEIQFTFFIFENGDPDRIMSSGEIIHQKGTIIELGDREAVLYSNSDIPDGHFVFGTISLGEDKVRLLSKASKRGSNGAGTYDLAYHGMSEKDRNAVLDHVFSVYREKRGEKRAPGSE